MREHLSSDSDAEANYFAMCLLLPERIVREYVAKYPVDPFEDKWLSRMAREFGVSTALAAKRLTELRLL